MKLSSNHLKLIAIFAMLIDHIGAVFFPETYILRIIGRLTMPIMAFMITEGYFHTQHLRRYMLRLLIFALITIYPYQLYFAYGPFNVLFTLLFGLIAITIYDRADKRFFKILGLVIPVVIATLFSFDGSFLAILLIFIFYKYRGNFKAQAINMVLMYFALEFAIYYPLLTNGMTISDSTMWIQSFALMSLPLLYRYNGQRGKAIINPTFSKYLFYVFYPLHITILLMIKLYF